MQMILYFLLQMILSLLNFLLFPHDHHTGRHSGAASNRSSPLTCVQNLEQNKKPTFASLLSRATELSQFSKDLPLPIHKAIQLLIKLIQSSIGNN
ncbi:hypothetical protein OWV82_007033 [Melia azedarach]|uniref:Uncharacterized protein n=1 Tax=Melia azedarach TaxID=155640 RepID=A0ACC1YIV1_MELAZ|nr:hypothetical protein OWV82_007033 [Melia azedarach]